ncbi:MAG: glycosyltransferase family 39 protein [Kofleriaceae bacterium]|nr:glycosyltransferase family 39 protein [Kofleriaceae bacterium]
MERSVFAAGLLAWLVAALVTCLWGAPLGHDEAQYALAASDLLGGRPLRWNYLSQGMLAVAVPGVAAGGSELALRVVPLILGVAFLLAAANLARRVTTPSTAAWLVAIMAASIGFAKRNAELLSDMPAAAGLLAGATVLVTELTRTEGPRWRTVLAAPAFAAAFYLRYGSVVPIAVIAVVALVAGWPGIVRRPLPVLATVAAFALLFVPHLLVARELTGAPLGILRQSSAMPVGRYPGVGLFTYVTSNPFTWYGVITTPVLLVGIASIVRVRERRLVMLWVMAIASIVGLGVTSIAQPRYIYFSLVILLVLGIETLKHTSARIAIAALGASYLATFAVIVVGLHQRPARMQHTFAAAAWIRADAAGRPCEVIGRHTTQLEWYSGCPAVLTRAGTSGMRTYVVSDADVQLRAP